MSDEIGLMGDMEPPEGEGKGEEKEEPKKVVRRYGFSISVDEPRRTVVGGSDVVFHVELENTGEKDDTIGLRVTRMMTAREGERAAEWAVDYPGDLEFRDDGEARVSEVELPVGKKRILDFVVHVPHGVRYGDKLAVVLNCVSRGDPLVSDSLTLAVAARQDYFLVKTALGQERDVVDAIGNRAIRSNVAVFAVLAPAKLRGYVFVEAMNKDRLKDVVRGIRKARGVVDRGDVSLTFEEILPYLTPKPLVSGIKEGDIVELVSGPFKGEKARVMSIDESREEITVELFEAMVPIPVTIRGDSVRVLEKSRG